MFDVFVCPQVCVLKVEVGTDVWCNLELHENDDVEKAVDKFVKEHKLSEEVRKRLVEEGRAHVKAPEAAPKPAPKRKTNKKKKNPKPKSTEEKPAPAPEATPAPAETATEATPAPAEAEATPTPKPAETEEKPAEAAPAQSP